MNNQGKSALAVSVAAVIGGTSERADATTYVATLTQVASYSNNGTAGSPGNITSSTGTWTYDDATNLITQSGGVFNVRLTTAPTSTLYRQTITGLVMGNGDPASAASFTCIEGNFGTGIGASICGNYGFGANFASESTTTWGPGSAFSRTIGGDDTVAGTQQSIATLNGMATVSWVGTTLILSNGTCTGLCLTSPGGFNAGQRWTFQAGPQAGPDTEPDPFTFADDLNVPLSSVRTSGAVTVAGIASAAPVTVAGGEYSIGCTDTYTPADGTINNGDTVCVRHTSAATPATDTVTTLTIGGIAGTFTSTTVAADSDPDAFSFAPQADVALGAPIDSAPATITGINVPTAISVTGGQYSIAGGAFTSVAGVVNDGQAVRVRVTSSASPLTPTTATLTVGGVDADFTVTTAAVQPDATPDQFFFVDQENVDRDTEIVSEPVEITGINTAAPILVTGGEYSIDGGPFTAEPGTITNGQSVVVRHTSASTSGTAVTTTLSVGPAGSGTRVSDAFSSATRRNGGSSSADGLILGVLGLLGLARRRQNRR